jgi:hypothetical protein
MIDAATVADLRAAIADARAWLATKLGEADLARFDEIFAGLGAAPAALSACDDTAPAPVQVMR